ncbi:MAG: hypothetical protein PHW18_04220 [Sulfuricurvum sp.]|uniref:hypothetical protein n=1 Tax=Sulfuricurvum sp. TaxID=2025608 RepID=UPI002618F562|nr:hypothetical protein [Sulfuricurvum sp.]MDD2828759.1 hypothetical protein [Sulfuricurvum sp.]MDD4949337.1 hypothetical protein [Sulfuricurvum sp.]
MKQSSLLLPLFVCGSLYAEILPFDSNGSIHTPTVVTTVPQEVIITNKEPFSVNVANFPTDTVQKVKLDSNDTIKVKLDSNDIINVMISNPVKLVEKEKPKITLLNDSKNVLTVENSSLLGELSTSLQAISINKVAVKNKYGETLGLKIRFVAEDKLEISKDFKILVDNEIYMDDDEVKQLQNAIAKMITIGSTPAEEKQFKLSFKTTGDFEMNLYSVKKMFGMSKGVEVSIIIAQEKKYSSKAILSLKELIELKTILDKYETTKINPI